MQPALVNRKEPIVQEHNARPHVSQIVANKLTKLKYKVLLHLPYLPDILPTDYHFFRQLDHFLCDKKYVNQEHVKNDFKSFIKTKKLNFYKNDISKFLTRWQKCVDNNGSYFD